MSYTASPSSSEYDFENESLHLALESTPNRTYSTLQPCRLSWRDSQAGEKLTEIQRENEHLREETRKLRAELLMKEAHLQSMSARIQALEQQTERSPDRTSKPKSSPTCKREVREAYTSLLDGDADASFDMTLSWDKQKKVKRLRREICNMYGKERWTKEIITDACKTYFTSLKEDESRKATQSFSSHRDKNRRRIRMRRKLALRQKGAKHLSEEEKEKAEPILSIDYTSSDEDTESDVRDVRILNWESEELAQLKKKMEQLFYENARPAEKRGCRYKARKVRADIVSDRPMVKGALLWAIKQRDNV